MQADDKLCLCFHVTWRKVINYARVHRVKVPSQLAECEGAGTGCGWCRSAMRRIISRADSLPNDPDEIDRWLTEDFPAAADYAAGRKQHIQDKDGT
ncbi:MAG: hypothetical protein Aurels2KO_48750 [Aureliella sp.]